MESEFDEELQYHLDRQIEQHVGRGMSLEEARQAARREFGNPTRLRDEARETWRWRRLDELAHDLRYAARSLRNNPGFSAVAILSLGFGIGAATSLFSVIDALDFRPLPYHEPDRLVWLTELTPENDSRCPRCAEGTSVATAADWWAQTSSYEALGLQGHTSLCLEQDGLSECPDVGAASPGFFHVLGVRPLLGRGFLPEDTLPGAAPVVMLSHETWTARFDGDPRVIGTQFEYSRDRTFRTRQYATVVGVLPRGFSFGQGYPIWTVASGSSQGRNAFRTMTAVARLKPGIEPAAAEAELRAVHSALAAAYPEVYEGHGAAVRPLRERLGIGAGEGRGTLFAITTIVLAIALMNVAGLLTARGAARQQEFAMRRALGASGARLVRQLLVEGATLGLAAGLLGCTLAAWGVRFANLSFHMERYESAAQVDHRVLAFGTGLSLVVGLVAALLPAAGVGRTDLYSPLRDPLASGRRRRAGWTSNLLLVGQIAAGLILLTGAALLGSEFLKLRYLDIGYHPVNVYEASVPGPAAYRAQPELLRPVAERARARIEVIPGVVSASLRHHNAMHPAIVRPAERIQPAAEREYIAVDEVESNYFETLGIPIVHGRALSPADRRGAPLVAVVNRAAASTLWPGEPALGRRVFLGDSGSAGEWATVVGVVEDVEWGEMVRRHWPRLYRPLAQAPIYHPFLWVEFRVSKGAPDVVRAVHAALRETLGHPVRTVTSHADRLDQRFLAQRINAVALNLFAAFALLLAAMGVYGSVAYAVTRRTREVGLRMAIGADHASILGLFTRRTGVVAVAGIALGCGGSFVLTRVLQSFVSAGSVSDPRVFGGAALLMAFVVLIATYLPARRATAVDPTIALRSE